MYWPVWCSKFVLIPIFLAALLSSWAAAEELRIGGTGGALGLMKRFAAEYRNNHPAARISILPSVGSSGGIKAVKAGAIDIAVTSRPLSPKESGLKQQGLGRTPFVLAVGKNSPVSSVSLKELPAMYSGLKSSWPDGRTSRPVLRPANEYDTTLLKSMSPEMERAVVAALAREGMILAVTDQDNALALERTPGALGTTTLGQITSEERRLKALDLDGVRPGLDTLAQGTYRYSKSYYLVTRTEARPAVKEFIDFVHSPAGQRIMARFAYQAVNH